MLWRRETGLEASWPGLTRPPTRFGAANDGKGDGEVKKRWLLGACDHPSRLCQGSSLMRRGVDGRVKPGQDGRGSEAGRKQPTNKYRYKSPCE